MFTPFLHKQKATVLFHILWKVPVQTYPFTYVHPHPCTQKWSGGPIFVTELGINLPYAYYSLLRSNLETEAFD